MATTNGVGFKIKTDLQDTNKQIDQTVQKLTKLDSVVSKINSAGISDINKTLNQTAQILDNISTKTNSKVDFSITSSSVDELNDKLANIKNIFSEVSNDSNVSNLNAQLKATVSTLENSDTGQLVSNIKLVETETEQLIAKTSSWEDVLNGLSNQESINSLDENLQKVSTTIDDIGNKNTTTMLDFSVSSASADELNQKLEEMENRLKSVASSNADSGIATKFKTSVSTEKDNSTGGLVSNIKVTETEKETEKTNNAFGIFGKMVNSVTDKFGSLGSKSVSVLSSMQSQLKRVSSILSINFLKEIASGFMKIYSKVSDCVASSAEYAENLNLLQNAFKDTADEATSFVNGLADIFGLDESTLTRQLGYYRQIGNALDLDSESADKLSKNLLKMQLDMSSLYNLSFDKSGEVMQSALAGQTKPIRSATGVDITESSLQGTLDSMGIEESVSNLSRAEKALTIYLHVLNSTEEAQGDLARTINSTANQQKIFSEQSKRLATAIGNVLSPVFTNLLTIINGVAMVMVELINMFAVFVGFSLEDTSSSVADLSDYLDDVETNATGASNALSGLRSFDKLNNMTTPSSSGSGSSVDSGISDALLSAIDDYDLKLGSVSNKATEVRDKIMEWLGFTKEVNEETGEITWKYDTLNKNVTQIAKEIGTNLGEALTEEMNSIDWAGIGSTIANGLNIAFAFINAFVDSFNWVDLGTNIATFLNNAIAELNWAGLGELLASKFQIIIDTLYGFVTTFEWTDFASQIAIGVQSWFDSIDWGRLGETVSTGITGIFNGIGRFMNDVDWEGIGNDISSFFENIKWDEVWESCKQAIAGAVTGIDDFLNGLFGEDMANVIEAIAIALGILNATIAVYNAVMAIAMIVTAPVTGIALMITGIIMVVIGVIALLMEYWDDLVQAVEDAWEFIQECLSGVGDWIDKNIVQPVEDAWENIKNIFSIENVKKLFTDALDAIKSVFSNIPNWFKTKFSEAWEKVKGVFSSGGEIFSGIKEGIEETFKTIVNKIIEGINKIIKVPFQKINDTLNSIRNCSFLGISPFKGLWKQDPLTIPVIPTLATGGFPEDGWFRASKGEYFGKFDDGTSYVANNKQITDGIRQATMNGMLDAMAMASQNKQNVNVTIVAEEKGSIVDNLKFKEKNRDRQYGV